MSGPCSLAELEASCDAFDRTEECESTPSTACGQVQTRIVQSCGWQTATHYWSETGSSVRDKMSVILSLASPTLADLTRAEKALRYMKRTRHLNLYLTIPAMKHNDLSKQLKNIMGYSDAELGWRSSDEKKPLLVPCVTLTSFS